MLHLSSGKKIYNYKENINSVGLHLFAAAEQPIDFPKTNLLHLKERLPLHTLTTFSRFKEKSVSQFFFPESFTAILENKIH